MSKLSHDKVATRGQVEAHFKSGMTIMTGGFGMAGYPSLLYDWLYESPVKDINIITYGVAPPEYAYQVGFAKLIAEYRVKKIALTHCALNPDIGRIMNEGRMEVEMIPQGTFAERIRAAGHGLGGVLTPTGIGTVLAEGKQIVNVQGRDYLLEEPLRAQVAMIRAEKADKMGNLMFKNTSRNVNTVMPMAADIVIAEVPVSGIVEVGEMSDCEVMVPGIFVDYVVPVPEGRRMI